MAYAGLSSRTLAEKVAAAGTKVSHQNIENIVAGKQHSCGRELRDALATALHIPDPEWLGAEHDLPELPWWEAPRTVGVEGGSGTDLNQRALPGTPWHQTLQQARQFFRLPETREAMPPRYQLLAWHLAKDIEDAWARSFGADGERVEYPATVSASEDEVARRVEWGGALYCLPAIAALLSLSFWRRVVMDEPYGGLVDREEMDRFAGGMEQAMRTLLRPWLEGRMELRATDELEDLFMGLAGLGRTLSLVEARSQVESHQELLGLYRQTRSAP